MEQIETQASDLRYLAQAPSAAAAAAAASAVLSESPGVSVSYGTPQPRTQASPGGGAGSASFGDNSALLGDTPASSVGGAGAGKRKSVDDGPGGAKQTRSKRNRYISLACNECKRRKIKCNGETPCQRCGNLNLACLYAPNCCSNNFKESDDFKQITNQLSRLQDEVNWLNQTVRTLQSEPRLPPLNERAVPDARSTIAPSPSQSSGSGPRPDLTNGRHGPFKGPTSIAYSLDVANATITNMGYKTTEEGDDAELATNDRVFYNMPLGQPDPIIEFDKDEMVRLCRVHEEEIGIMYPVLNIEDVIAHAQSIAPVLTELKGQRSPTVLNDLSTLQLKIILCCALVTEGHGHSDKAVRLFNSMESVITRKLMIETADVACLPLLALVAGYRFLSNEEVSAWRVMGQVVRLCMELGIHQRRGLVGIHNETERKNALNSFWSAYVLDRRWAFGTGLPYAMHDDEIDPNLSMPDEYPYLVAMITYSKIGAKVWRQVSHFGPVLARELRHEEIDRLDNEIKTWYETVPAEVKVRNWASDKYITATPSYNLQRLRIWTYLRYNQIRLWLYTPVLHSATSIMSSPVYAQNAVELARDTIRYLAHLNNTTNLYRRTQVFYHQFLTSAISVLFLASVHAPVRFSPICREEFYMALTLVKDLSAKSWVSQRLWRTIKSLKDVAPRFGLDPDNDRHSTAALGMMELTRGHMDPVSVAQSYPAMSVSAHQQQGPPSSGPEPMAATAAMNPNNGTRIQSELSRIFEGYVGLNTMNVSDDGVSHAQSEMQSPASQTPMYSANGTLFPQLREMF